MRGERIHKRREHSDRNHYNSYCPSVNCNREQLLSIVYAVKEKIGESNLLEFYIDRLNTKKGINKYFNNVFNDVNLEKHADLIIKYLDQFKPRFIEDIKKYENKIDEYIKNKEANNHEQ